jgi:hypothetical protein
MGVWSAELPFAAGENRPESLRFLPPGPAALCLADPDACRVRDQLSAGAAQDSSPLDKPVAQCEVDPRSCQREFAPSPICAIDPCSCYDCSKDKRNYPSLFESGGTTPEAALQASSLAARLAAGSDRFEGSFRGVFGAVTTDSDAPTTVVAFRADRSILSRFHSSATGGGLLCNNAKERPREFWRELILSAKQVIECSEAAEIVLDQREKYWNSYVDILTGRLARSDARGQFKLFENYRDACIWRLADIKPTAAVRFSLGQDFLQRVHENVGELNFPGRARHCTASVVRTEVNGQPTLGLATASHCIGDPTEGAGSGKLQFGSVHQSMSFINLDGQKYGVEISPDVRGYIYGKSNDAVIIPIAFSPPSDFPHGFDLAAETELWEPLYIVGMNPLLAVLDQAVAGTSELPKSVSISFEPGCRVYAIDGPTLLHNCQTEGGMSGSPIFISSGGIAKIIAVHSGEREKYAIPACAEGTAGAANYGTLLRRLAR